VPDEPAELLVPGCEAASAVSQAVCQAGAHLTGRQLYEHIAFCLSESVSYLISHVYCSLTQTITVFSQLFICAVYSSRITAKWLYIFQSEFHILVS